MARKGRKRSRAEATNQTSSKTEEVEPVVAAEVADPAPSAKKRRRRGKGDKKPAAAEAEAGSGSGETTTADASLEGAEVRGMAVTAPKAAPVKYINKQRVLVFCSRGVTARFRHLMEDMRNLIPHHKKDAKLDSKDDLSCINEVAEMKRCNSSLFFEARKKKDLYLWMSKTPNGPSVKFHVQNIHTMDELRMTGNCLKGSRPLLSFDAQFDTKPHLQLLKEMFSHVFGTPRGHPKSQPFNDHVMCFYCADNKVWFRHYQIVDVAINKTAKARVLKAGQEPTTLVEIGPRFVMDIIRIFSGSFGGRTLFQNGDYVSPNLARQQQRQAAGQRYGNRVDQQAETKNRVEARPQPKNVFGDVFK